MITYPSHLTSLYISMVIMLKNKAEQKHYRNKVYKLVMNIKKKKTKQKMVQKETR